MGLMNSLEKAKSDLDEKFQKISKTPPSFNFFVAIHDFIEVIELNPYLSRNLSSCIKSNQKLKILSKYSHLKKIYQGLEDANVKSNVDLGHERYMVIIELNKIKNKDFSGGNSFWKKRELFRRLTSEIYEVLNPELA